MSELKGFYDPSYEGEKVGQTLPAGTYLFQVVEAEVDEWDDGRPRLDISTRVVGGEQDGMYGPRVTLTLGASSGETKRGRKFVVTEEAAAQRVRVMVKMIHPGSIPMRNPSSYDKRMLEDIADALSDEDVFVGRTQETEDGYTRMQRIWAVDNPPRGFIDPRREGAFSL